MNEKIKELRNKALEKYVFTDVDGDNNHGIKLNEEKFAELIIRECAEISEDNFHHGFAGAREMRKHIGVEE